EIDPVCLRAARLTLRGRANVELVEGDALRTDRAGLELGRTWLAAGNIPYQMTGALLTSLFEKGAPPSRAVLLGQREVARRLAAGPGDWSLATVAVRSVAEVEVLADAPPSSFRPQPEVHSSLMRLTPAAVLSGADREAVLRLARSAFQQRRKTLRHGITHA